MINFETSKGKFAFTNKPMLGVLVIGNTDELTEEEWRRTVDWGNEVLTFKNYLSLEENTYTATESGKSLMKSLNITGDWLLVKYED